MSKFVAAFLITCSIHIGPQNDMDLFRGTKVMIFSGNAIYT